MASLTVTSQYYTLSFGAPESDDHATVLVSVSGFFNRYSADELDSGISVTTSKDGYLIDTSPLTQLSD